MWLTYVGPAVGILAFGFTIFVFVKTWKFKRLNYEVRVDQDLVVASRYTNPGELSVRFQEHEVERPRVVVIRVTNTGKEELPSSAFESPLTVKADAGTKILSAAIALRESGQKKDVEVVSEQLAHTEVKAPKQLLNAGDWLEFRLLVDGEPGSVDLEGRVAGANLVLGPPRRLLPSRLELAWIGLVLTLLFLAALGAALWFAVSDFFRAQTTVPDLVGDAAPAAVGEVEESSLVYGHIHHIHDPAPPDTVISQSPPAGELVDEGSSISIVISLGP